MFNKRIVPRIFPLLLIGMTNFCAAAASDSEQLVAQVKQAAQQELERLAGMYNWVEPEFTIDVVRNSRPIGACSQAPRVEAADARAPARMRFVAICPDQRGWRYDFVTRATISAMVVIAASDLSTGKVLAADDLLLERHDITGVPDSYPALAAVQDLATRRTIRAGTVLRPNMVVAPPLVKRGQPVQIVARNDGIEVSMGGEALDTGARDALVRVKNTSGVTIRAKVVDAGVVEPVR